MWFPFMKLILGLVDLKNIYKHNSHERSNILWILLFLHKYDQICKSITYAQVVYIVER